MTTFPLIHLPKTLQCATRATERASSNAIVWLLISTAIILRLALASFSIGSNDATTFFRFTTEIRQLGLLHTYGADSDFNHPPIPALWAMLARDIAGDNLRLFVFIFKLPAIISDGVSIFLLWTICKSTAGRGLAVIASIGMALSPDSILVSGFHCNTDSCYAMLCLLCVYLIESRARFFWGGLALAAAINVKLIPVLLIPPLLLSCRHPRDAWRFLLGLSIGVIPFIPPLYANRIGFLNNVVNYGSVIDRWGISFFLMGPKRSFDPTTVAGGLTLYYSRFGRMLIPLIVVAWAVIARRLQRWNRYQLCAITFAIFLILTPGFGPHYTAIIGPLLFAAATEWAIAYAVASGAFLACGYYSFWDGKFPIYANYTDQLSIGVGIIGVFAWIILIGYVSLSMLTQYTSPQEGDHKVKIRGPRHAGAERRESSVDPAQAVPPRRPGS